MLGETADVLYQMYVSSRVTRDCVDVSLVIHPIPQFPLTINHFLVFSPDENRVRSVNIAQNSRMRMWNTCCLKEGNAS